jgi:hypothetical protein
MRGVKVTYPAKYLKCVKEIDSCPELAIGDLLWNQTREIWPGGYEYVAMVRRDDGRVLKFRVEHLEDCFEEVNIEEEMYV